MSGHRPFSDLTKDFSPERQARVAEQVRTLKQAMALAELREARAQSQADLAAGLHVQQPAVAKMERRTDMYVSNLRRFIEALGGTLEIVAHFPEGSVTITQFAAIDTPPDEVSSPEEANTLPGSPNSSRSASTV
jgi:transcriptional regulator with XRE-family HTH domain